MAYFIPRNLMNEGVMYNKPKPLPKERKEKPNWDQMRADMGLPPADVPDAPPFGTEPQVVQGLAGRTVVIPPSMQKPPAVLSPDLLPADDWSRSAADQIRTRLQTLMGTSFAYYEVISYKTLVGGTSNGGTLFIKIRVNQPPYGCVHARVYERSGRAMLIAFEGGKTDEEKIELFDGPAGKKA